MRKSDANWVVAVTARSRDTGALHDWDSHPVLVGNETSNAKFLLFEKDGTLMLRHSADDLRPLTVPLNCY